MLDVVVTEYKAVLKSYEIPHITFELPGELDENYDLEANNILCYLRSLLPIKRIVNDTFQLLFGDREFLLHFNLITSQFVKNMKVIDYPEILAKMGFLKEWSADMA